MCSAMRVDRVLDDWDEETLELVNPGTPLERIIRQMGILCDRQLFKTDAGRIGFGKKGVRTGDTLCIFNGAPVPHLLRDIEDEPSELYALFGEAYVHGIMNGQLDRMEFERKNIVIA